MSAVALQSFGFGDQLVRTLERDGSIWFVANDVCASLEIVNSRRAVSALADDEKGVHTVNTLGGAQEVTIISESGVYCLIFKSRKPIAVTFRKWVTGEVLPALRQHGRYDMAADAEEDDEDIGMPVPFMGSQADRDNFRTAVAVVRMYERIEGPAAARAAATRLGFPQFDVDLLPTPVPAATARTVAPGMVPLPVEQSEGDVVLWGRSVCLVPSKYDATHKSELYTSYTKWCSAYRFRVMHPDRWEKIMLTIYGVEEHPEMFRCVMRRG